MGRKKADENSRLKYEVKTRVDQQTFTTLTKLLQANSHQDMSRLVRSILCNRPVKVYTHDRSLDLVMEELSSLRAEIRAIGVNMNQLTRYFNSYPDARRKEFYAKVAFHQYKSIEPKIDQLLTVISRLAKKWLSE